MRLSDVRFLFEFDRWATVKLLDAAVGVDARTWSAANAIGQRGLGGILVHALGAHQRWRLWLSGSSDEPRPETEPLPTVAGLEAAWAIEWSDLDAWLASLDDGALGQVRDGVPYWQMLAHVVNHGTQHRSEAAVLLTAIGHSPGDLDLIDYARALASTGL
jgi:uncharacterized damage-inducible protein DinB